MFAVHNLPLAILFCVVTMLGWGSWANTLKLAGKDKWPFELFYWDYAIGVAAMGAIFAFTLGSFGSSGMPTLPNLDRASSGALWIAFLSGAVFNVANILLVVAIDAAGMAVAFPVGVGLALVIGTVESFVETPRGNAPLLFAGVALIVLAMVMSALAHRRLPRKTGMNGMRGLVFAVIAGCLMGFFYPQLVRSISRDFNNAPIEPGRLTPYTALLLFGAGLLVSNLIVNTVFMRVSRITYGAYFRGSARLHFLGFLGGCIWMVALSLNVIASGVAGPAISYALGQGATLVAAIWGVLIWREFREAPQGTTPFVASMFVCYAAGLILIGSASL